MQNNLITIEEIISRARKSGTFLGHGNPKVHLAYLTKIRLLPQAIRRKIANKITGCYPEYVVFLLQKIEELRTKGLTYSQIRFQLETTTAQIQETGQKSFESSILHPVSGNNSSIAFLLIGLILGFLLAHNNNSSNPTLAAQAVPVATVPVNTISQPLVRSTIENDSFSSDPIYLIAIPEKNLYKLGKTDINYLR